MPISDTRTVIVGQSTFSRLSQLIARQHSKEFLPLEDELDAATIVDEQSVPKNVVTMNSVVTYEDMKSGRQSTVRLVYPQDHQDANSVSILAPVGAALIGLQVGQQIAWPLPNGKSTQLKIVAVVQEVD